MAELHLGLYNAPFNTQQTERNRVSCLGGQDNQGERPEWWHWWILKEGRAPWKQCNPYMELYGLQEDSKTPGEKISVVSLGSQGLTQLHKESCPRLADNIQSSLGETEKFLTELFMGDWDHLYKACIDWYPKATWGEECLRSHPHKGTEEQRTTMPLLSVPPTSWHYT